METLGDHLPPAPRTNPVCGAKTQSQVQRNGPLVCDIDTLPVGLQMKQALAGAGSWSKSQQGQAVCQALK